MENSPRVRTLNQARRRVLLGGRARSTPAWWRLLGLALIGLGILALVETREPAGAWRTAAETAVTVLMFAAMAGWVRMNRGPMARMDECARARPSVEIGHIADVSSTELHLGNTSTGGLTWVSSDPVPTPRSRARKRRRHARREGG